MSIEKIKILMLSFAFAASVGISHSTRADLDISDSPLFVSVSIGPNLMFMLDDSGSMFWSFMPDTTFGARTSDRAKSNAFNAVYYDPEVNYQLPVDHNGDPLPEPSFNGAWMDGYAHYRGDWSATVNLSSSFRPTWYYDWSWQYYAGGAEPAYYYNFDETCGNVNSDACYDKVVVGPTSGPGGTDERQNFANWYSYYRNRLAAARAGIGRAFAQLPDAFRLGWGRINKQWYSTIDGDNVRAVQQGVRQMEASHREDFYDWLYSTEATGGTPLRRSLEGAGDYFENESANGPWSSTPGESGGSLLECRQSFSILMTDGFWNGGDPSVDNEDGEGSTSHTGPGDQSGGYTPSDPFQDDYDETLADVAMYFWKNDLHSGIENRVPASDRNPAFWQHMVTYTVGLGVEGSINPDEAFAAIETGDPIAWPNVWADAGGPNIDDMLHAAVNSRGGFFSARDPDTFATELAAVLQDIIARTAATTGASLSLTRVTGDTLVYAAEFDSNDWSGELKAINAEDGMTEYEATDELALMGADGREIFTFDPDSDDGIAFDDDSVDAIGERIMDNAPSGGYWTAENLINYIRGDNALEGNGSGQFRPRSVMLGDIVNSRPVFSGPGNQGWGALGGYLDYIGGKKNDPRDCDEVDGACDYARKDTVFVGANDGMLHAFDGRSLKEFFAYVPSTLHGRLHHLADQNYSHKFFLDGQVAASDARPFGSWGTYLVGTLGAGGRGVFALDVTDPETFSADDVLWELSAEDDPDLGYTFGEPVISRLENGTWVAVFGNGYNSDDEQAKLFVVRLSDGEILHKVSLGDAGNNGLSGVVGWRDASTQGYLERIYAGDLNGTVWRVDFESSEPSVTYGDGLFTDPDGRPITATPNLAAHPSGGLMVYFGTGKLIENSDRLGTALDRFYAIRDLDSSEGNADDLGDLSEVVITEATPDPDLELPPVRALESSGISVNGWYMDLAIGESTGERTLAKPRVAFGSVIMATYEPIEDPCTPGGIQRTYVVDALSGGGALPYCPSCGGIEVGVGAPFSPPIAIKPRDPGNPDDIPFPGYDDPDDPEGTTFPSAPDSDSGTREGWCSDFGIPPLFESAEFLPLGTICEGRQVWRDIK